MAQDRIEDGNGVNRYYAITDNNMKFIIDHDAVLHTRGSYFKLNNLLTVIERERGDRVQTRVI